MKDNSKGFTLIELVITIAVIAIISAVIAPSFLGTTEKARIKTDIQSARVLQNAVDLYDAEQSTPLSRTDVDDDIQTLVSSGYLSEAPTTQTGGQWVYDTNKKIKLKVSGDAAVSSLSAQELQMVIIE